MTGDAGDEAAPPIVRLFGDTGRAKLLSVFATRRHREFNLTELAREAGVSRKTAYEHIDDLVGAGVVTERDAARGTRYAADPDSDVAAAVYELHCAVLRRELERFAGFEPTDDAHPTDHPPSDSR